MCILLRIDLFLLRERSFRLTGCRYSITTGYFMTFVDSYIVDVQCRGIIVRITGQRTFQFIESQRGRTSNSWLPRWLLEYTHLRNRKIYRSYSFVNSFDSSIDYSLMFNIFSFKTSISHGFKKLVNIFETI